MAAAHHQSQSRFDAGQVEAVAPRRGPQRLPVRKTEAHQLVAVSRRQEHAAAGDGGRGVQPAVEVLNLQEGPLLPQPRVHPHGA